MNGTANGRERGAKGRGLCRSCFGLLHFRVASRDFAVPCLMRRVSTGLASGRACLGVPGGVGDDAGGDFRRDFPDGRA